MLQWRFGSTGMQLYYRRGAGEVACWSRYNGILCQQNQWCIAKWQKCSEMGFKPPLQNEDLE